MSELEKRTESESAGSSGSAAVLTDHTASTSRQGTLDPARLSSSCGFSAAIRSMRAWCSSFRPEIASRSVGFPSPMSPPEKKMPNGDEAMRPASATITTSPSASAPRDERAATAARAEAAAIRA